MSNRPIESTPNRQHTTALNHGWQGTIKTPLSAEEKAARREYLAAKFGDKRKRNRFKQVMQSMFGEDDAVDKLCKEISQGRIPQVSRTYGGFKIIFS